MPFFNRKKENNLFFSDAGTEEKVDFETIVVVIISVVVSVTLIIFAGLAYMHM